MKRHARPATALLVVLTMILFALPMINVMAGCFGGCDLTPPPPPILIMPTVAPSHAIDMNKSISFNDSDLGVVLYKVQDEAGSAKMDVYGLKTEGSISSYLFSITQDDLAPFADQHPTTNTLLAEADGVSVYLLTTGEIQVNAGPDSEGKMHVKILDGIPWTTVYGYTVDAQ